jgi:hypothetical protein
MLMLRLAALVFSAWVLLSGCAGPTYSYSKPGSSELDWKQDSYACAQDPRTSGGATGRVGAATDPKRLYMTCMEARGWTAEAPR